MSWGTILEAINATEHPNYFVLVMYAAAVLVVVYHAVLSAEALYIERKKRRFAPEAYKKFERYMYARVIADELPFVVFVEYVDTKSRDLRVQIQFKDQASATLEYLVSRTEITPQKGSPAVEAIIPSVLFLMGEPMSARTHKINTVMRYQRPINVVNTSAETLVSRDD